MPRQLVLAQWYKSRPPGSRICPSRPLPAARLYRNRKRGCRWRLARRYFRYRCSWRWRWLDGVRRGFRTNNQGKTFSPPCGSVALFTCFFYQVYRVEGESYVRSEGEFIWDSNRRLFPDGDGVIATSNENPTVKYYPRGNKGEGKAVVLGVSYDGPDENMLFLNSGERARAEAYYAQRLLQYRKAVDHIKERGMTVLHKHHNMKIRSFKIMTRAAKDLQRRAITELERHEDLKPYNGVLLVDIDKAPNQYGCTRRIYSPLLRKAIQGSYMKFTPWLDHLPSRLLRLIVDHQIKYGRVRVVFVALPGSALPALLDFFLESDIANRLATGSNNQSATLTSMTLPLSQFKETAIEHVQIRDVPVVGLRQAREAKCGRQLQTGTDHGRHFEYLAEFPDGSTHWYPSMSMRHASEVAGIIESKGTELTVRRRNNTVDHVHQNQIFWAEDPAEEYLPLHDEEIDCLVKHGHDDEHLDVCVPATLTFRSDWAKIETTTAGTTVRRDDAFDANVYENVTFTNTSTIFVIVNHGAFTDITVSHGRDGDRLGDMAGSASVIYAAVKQPPLPPFPNTNNRALTFIFCQGNIQRVEGQRNDFL
ncbi:hypothetical protein GGR54DRAFT_630639 [Hypoxylon sp. NC1633]|nr:hypothetical protein GGR54DRAFT_630639 [Hypoxylon sp. NC1633]